MSFVITGLSIPDYHAEAVPCEWISKEEHDRIVRAYIEEIEVLEKEIVRLKNGGDNGSDGIQH